MTALAQVRHVFVKDVQEHRWLLALYVAMVLVATGHALGWRPFAAPMLGGTMMVVGLAGILVVASVVQGDSPTRSDAFWVSHPLEPLAVLAAKGVLALLVLAVAVAGQAIAVGSYHPASGDTVRLLLHPSVSFATIIIAAIVAASLTRDLRTFALAAIVVPVTLIITFTLLTAYAARVFAIALSSRELAIARWMALAIGGIIVAWLYRTRDPRMRTRLLGYFAAGVAVLTTAISGMDLPSRPANVRVPRIPLSLEASSPNMPGNPDKLVMSLVVPELPEGYLFAFRAPLATVTFADGSSAKVSLGYGYFGLSDDHLARTPIIPGIRWRRLRPPRSGESVTLAAELTPAQRLAIDAGGATVSVDAHVDVDTLRAEESTPLVAGAVMTRDGRRTRIERWSHASGIPDLIVHSASVTDDASRAPSLGGSFTTGVEYALVNRSRGEGIPLGRAGMGVEMDGLVLPGSTLSATTIRYNGNLRVTGGPELPDDDWYRDAELLAITRRALGSYPVILRVRVAPR